MTAPWQNDWHEFVESLSAAARSDDPSKAIADGFAGRSVMWTGVLDEKSTSGLLPRVGIGVDQCSIDLGNGRLAVLDGFPLILNREDLAAWINLPLGSRVTFTGTMDSISSPFPAIQIKHLDSGTSVILMGLSNGQLVAAEAPPTS